MSVSYFAAKRKRLAERAMAGVRKKARKRAEERFEGAEWSRVRTLIVGVWAHSDGRHVGVYVDGKHLVAGSERTMRARLAEVLWKAGTSRGGRGRNGTGGKA